MMFLGIDPGGSGGMAVVDLGGQPVTTFKFDKATERDIWDALKDHSLGEVGLAVIERVNAMPKQGVSSTFKFGVSFGFLRGLLVASGLAYELVGPVQWQNFMQCRTGGDKNISKAKAHQLFPMLKITHANADALLIAEYARRTWRSRNQ